MKRVLMLFIAVSLVCSCKSTKDANASTDTVGRSIEKKIQQSWVLENLNGKPITEKDFSSLPKIELKASTFSGSTGCNAIKGNLLSKDAGQIQFLNFTSETKKCEAKKEGEFAQLLKTTSGYTIENNKLLLSNQFGPTMLFKKGN
ncbi:META domain-containing protein [Flavobacterium sp. ov086]|uniref:META domain-containing protein n=1 Tax=Flavobacterium sp. ov086 TaxID=1761785 RepID=UPI000B7868E0|nr:META domain-containing protein [Flavobacterium sp. ov086]